MRSPGRAEESCIPSFVNQSPSVVPGVSSLLWTIESDDEAISNKKNKSSESAHSAVVMIHRMEGR
jgi:hypothetical protein